MFGIKEVEYIKFKDFLEANSSTIKYKIVYIYSEKYGYVNNSEFTMFKINAIKFKWDEAIRYINSFLNFEDFVLIDASFRKYN